MTALDWALVVLLNGSIIVYALLRGKETHTSSDWFLAGRTLSWWVIGLSMYATAIDSSDMVVDAGGAYQFGASMFIVSWVGIVAGWLLMAYVIALPMYRSGMYTNAEYLEARFGPAARIISVLVQVQFRTMVLGMIGQSFFLTLVIVIGMTDAAAWSTVVVIALLATVYTMTGGLKAVAVTDAMQSGVMIMASIAMFVVVYNHVGGWSGIEEKLQGHGDEQSTTALLNVGTDRVQRISTLGLTSIEVDKLLLLGGEHDESLSEIVSRTPVWLVCFSLIITGVAYAVVNHTQSMRMFGARSEWDFKLSVVLASAVLIGGTYLNLMQGVMGRAVYPAPELLPVPASLQTVDAIFPVLLRDLVMPGLKGVVVAGIMAASFSTYDSIGSSLSALLTRDLYGRLLVTDRDDQHYLFVGRWLTPLIIFGSFLYLPWLGGGMFSFYLQMVGAIVSPLLTVYLMGSLTRVHRRSGAVGLAVGGAYGIWWLVSQQMSTHGIQLLPRGLMNPMSTAPVSMLVTALSMVLYSLLTGWTPKGELLHEEPEGWLRTTQQEVIQASGHLSERRGNAIPLGLGLLVLGLGLWLSFIVFW